jgi:hypothetical protein
MKIKAKLAILLAVLLVVPAYGAERVQLKFKNDADVFAALKPIRALKKDQYETSADFTKHVCAESYKALGVDDQTPVTFGTNFGEDTIKITYDADKQAFVVQLWVAPHPILDDNAPSEDRLMLEPDISNITDWSVLLATRPVKVLST